MNTRNCLFFGLIIFVHQIFVPQIECLLWSQFTLFQVNCAISWPIPYKNPNRKIFWNIGFQFNYNEPFLPSNFYRPPFFQNGFTGARARSGPMDQTPANETIAIEFPNETSTQITVGTSSEHGITVRDTAKHISGRDVTAGELYSSIEDHMESIGYDRSCLLKSICELARHPLHMRANDDNLLEEILHFVLTPTVHDGFTPAEQEAAKLYREAQKRGEEGGDCHLFYSECANSFLERMTHINDQQNMDK